MIGIVVSKEDTASQLIGENLRDLRDWDTYTDESLQSGHGDEVYQCDGFEMRIFDDLHLSLSDVSSLFNSPDLIIFASRHAGDTGPLLTTHFTGNFGSADYGGDPTELAIAAPYAQRRIYHALRKNAPPAYDVGIECTHHGPTNVGSPSLFVEIGSDAEQWQDTSAAKAVAQSILAVEGINVQSNKQIVWFGGGHYASRPEKIIKETDWSVGHIAADWSLTSLGSPQDHTDVIQQVFEKSDATKAVIEGDHTSLSEVISQLGYQVTSETWIRETDGVALSLVAQLERQLKSIEAGLRLGNRAKYSSEYTIKSPPEKLINELQSIDRKETIEKTDNYAIAYETIENGNRLDGRIAIEDDKYQDLIEAWLSILEERFDKVEYTDNIITVKRSTFDPELARKKNIPEGPAFGKLANGESVTINGSKVTPEEVETTETHQFEIAQRQ